MTEHQVGVEVQGQIFSRNIKLVSKCKRRSYDATLSLHASAREDLLNDLTLRWYASSTEDPLT